MKEYAKQPESVSRNLDKQPRASRQAPLSALIHLSSTNKNIVQRYHIQDDTKGIFLAQELRRTQKGTDTFLSDQPGKANLRINHKVNLRVSDTGDLAIEDGMDKREAKIFYGTRAIQDASNSVLQEIGSPIRLGINSSATISVTSATGQHKTLYAIYPIDVIAKKIGEDVQVPENCNEAGPHILNTSFDSSLKPKLNQHGWADGIESMRTNEAIFFILNYLKQQIKKKQEYRILAIIKAIFHYFFPPKEIENIDTIWADFEKNPLAYILPYVESINTGILQNIIQEIGINQFCDPEVGEMLSIRAISHDEDCRVDGPDMYIMDHSTGTEIKDPFPYHYASVIAKSGSDYITMENYARREDGCVSNKDPRYFFQMYGPEKQSFHEVMKKDYPTPMTFVYGKQNCGRQKPEYDIDSPEFEAMQEHYNTKMKYWDPAQTPIFRNISPV